MVPQRSNSGCYGIVARAVFTVDTKVSAGTTRVAFGH